MARRVSRLVLSICLLVSLIHGVATAQNLTLAGRVIDPQGGALVNADVTLTGAGQPRTIKTTTCRSAVRSASQAIIKSGDLAFRLENGVRQRRRRADV